MTNYEKFAAMVVARHDDRDGERLMNTGPEDQVPYVASKLMHFAKTTPLVPVINTDISLAGFGVVPAHFAYGTTRYMLLSEITEALGWQIQKAVKWADNDYDMALRDQRDLDEQRGDGRLGYECLRDYLDLGVDALVDDPEANPDAGGQRWSHTGDWLVSDDRLPWLLSCSNWGEEYMDNTRDLMRHAFTGAFGSSVPEAFRPALPHDEALRRARRGPALDA